MENLTDKEGKTAAIISYLTIIGTIIAFVMNQKDRNSFASFHIRQAIGIFLLFFASGILAKYGGVWVISRILNFGILILLIIGIIGAIQGEEKKVPFFGDKFQEWFRNIG